MLGFRNEPIDNMLAIGAVTDRGVRVWTRVAEAEPHELCCGGTTRHQNGGGCASNRRILGPI
jgi:hypothetical protein